MNLADVGSGAYRARVASGERGGGGGSATIGFTDPGTILREADSVDVAAKGLLNEMGQRLPPGDALRESYVSWFDGTWTPFYASLRGPTQTFVPFARLMGTDERFQLLQARRAELADFQAKLVDRTKQASAVVVPVDPRTAPPQPPGPSGLPSWWPRALTPPRIEVPWWAWLVGGGVLVGGGFLAYKAWQRSREERAAVLDVLPRILSPYGAAAPAHAPMLERDPAPCHTCGGE